MSKRRELYRGYGEDCLRLQKVIAKTGYVLCLVEAEEFWQWHSNQQCASWLCLPTKDSEIEEIVEEELMRFWDENAPEDRREG